MARVLAVSSVTIIVTALAWAALRSVIVCDTLAEF